MPQAPTCPQCLQNVAPRLGHAWRPGPAHTQGVSRTQLVYRVQVSPTLCAKFHVDCTVNNMKNPRCVTGLSIRYVGLPFVILISFMYDMYFAVIVIWLCICLDPWSIKNYYYIPRIMHTDCTLWCIKLHLHGTRQAPWLQHDCGATAAPKNRNIGIRQEHLHGDTPACSKRVTAASPAGNLSLNLKLQCGTCCLSSCLSFLWRTPTSKTADTWIICRSRMRQLPTM